MYKIQQQQQAEEEMERLLAECDAKLPRLERARVEAAQTLGLMSKKAAMGLSSSPPPSVSYSSSASRKKINAAQSHEVTKHEHESSVRVTFSRPSTSLEIVPPPPPNANSNRNTKLVATPNASNSWPSSRAATSLGFFGDGSTAEQREKYSKNNTEAGAPRGLRSAHQQRESTAILLALMSSETCKDMMVDRRWCPVKKGMGKLTQKPSIGVLAGAVTRDMHHTFHNNERRSEDALPLHAGSNQSTFFLTIASAGNGEGASAGRKTPLPLMQGDRPPPSRASSPHSPHLSLSPRGANSNSNNRGTMYNTNTNAADISNSTHANAGTNIYSNETRLEGCALRDVLVLGAGTRGLGPVGEALDRVLQQNATEAFIERCEAEQYKAMASRSPLSPGGATCSPPQQRLTPAQLKQKREEKQRKQAMAIRLQRERDEAELQEHEKEALELKKEQAENAKEERRAKERAVEQRHRQEAQEVQHLKAIEMAKREQLWEYHDEKVEAELMARAARREEIEQHREHLVEERQRLMDTRKAKAEAVREALAKGSQVRGAFDASLDKAKMQQANEIKISYKKQRPLAILEARKKKKAVREESVRRKAYEKVLIEQHAFERRQEAKARKAAALGGKKCKFSAGGDVTGGNGEVNAYGGTSLNAVELSPMQQYERMLSGLDEVDPTAAAHA